MRDYSILRRGFKVRGDFFAGFAEMRGHEPGMEPARSACVSTGAGAQRRNTVIRAGCMFNKERYARIMERRRHGML